MAPTDAAGCDERFIDELRLVWSLKALPQVAMNLRTRTAFAIGSTAWFALAGAVVAGLLPQVRKPFDSLDRALDAMLGTFFIGGAVVTTLIVLAMLFLSVDPDVTTEHHRARVRLVLLLPVTFVLPMLIWAPLATLSLPSVGILIGGKPAWLISPVCRVLGSEWWLLPLVIAMVIQLWRGWDGMLARATGDCCVGCGYPLIGLTSPRCPECGRELYPGQSLPASAPGDALSDARPDQ
jgi:hypothetical protein